MRISDWSSDVCSSDLGLRQPHEHLARRHRPFGGREAVAREEDQRGPRGLLHPRDRIGGGDEMADVALRSEEHTSELQSLMRISYAVFCLKKKTARSNTHTLVHNSINCIESATK